MNNNKYKFITRLLCFIIIIAMIFTTSSVAAEGETGTNKTNENQTEAFLKKGTYTDANAMLSSMEKVAKSGDSELYYCKDTADIAVRNSLTGDIWFSSPYAYKNDLKASDEIKSHMASFLYLTYYDYDGNMFEMNSFNDCVAKNQFSVEKIKNGISVAMSIGKAEQTVSLPVTAEAERFEKKVISKLTGIGKRRVEAFYTRYSYKDENLDEKTKERILKLYPGFSDYDLYILREDASDRDKQLLTEYISESDYTAEDYADDLKKSGSKDSFKAAALFKITVEFYLEDGALCVNIPTEKISYDKNSFILNKIRILEYFGAGDSKNEGYIFIPNGSGSLINFNGDSSKKILSTVCQLYGKDAVLLANDEYKNLTQQSCLPVYGVKESSKAFLAIIEQGDAMAQITAQSGNIISQYESVFADFIYATVQTYLYEDGKKQNGQWTYYDKNYYKGNYTIRYEFLTGGSADYMGMAKAYRNYLINKGTLEKLSAEQHTPIYIETIGQITRKDSFLGIPYNKKIAITSFLDAKSISKELKENGVLNISLRYKGWMNGGLNSTAPSKIKVEKKLGGAKGLKALNSYLKKNNFALYPEVNFNIVRNNSLFDSYSTIFDSPRSNDDHIATVTPAEELNNISEIQNNYSAIAPAKTTRFYEKFFNKYSSFGIDSVAISNAGNMLYSDFSKEAGINRQQSVDILKKNIEKNVKGGKFLTDGANAYIYPYVSDILGVPSINGGNITEDEAVPFIQIVLHGYIRYAGSAVNLSDNMQYELLKSAETGASLYFTVGYKDTEYLKDTTLSYLYTVDYNTWKEDIISLYKKYDSVFAKLQNVEITDHEKLAEDVYKTTYADKTAVITNYNEQAVSINGITVNGKDFAVVQ